VPDKYYRGAGCPRCNGTGYKGRIGAYELVTMSTELKQLVSSSSIEDDLWEAAVRAGTKTMFEDAWSKMLEGSATIEDIISRIPYPHILLKSRSTAVQSAPVQSAPAQSAPAQSAPAQSAPAQKNQKKALLFDSNEEEVQLVRSTLETNGYDIIHATNVELMKMAQDQTPELIIITNSQEKLDILKEIRNNEQLEYTPIICLADEEYKDREFEGFSLGINDFVYRPIEPNKLLMSVKLLMETL
jgi:PleD family two-component response regulator